MEAACVRPVKQGKGKIILKNEERKISTIGISSFLIIRRSYFTKRSSKTNFTSTDQS
jgi:hypothetical protein